MDLGGTVSVVSKLIGGLGAALGFKGGIDRQHLTTLGKEILRGTKAVAQGVRGEIGRDIGQAMIDIAGARNSINRKLDTQHRDTVRRIGDVLSVVRGIAGATSGGSIRADVRDELRPVNTLIRTIAPTVISGLSPDLRDIRGGVGRIETGLGDMQRGLPHVISSSVLSVLPSIGDYLMNRASGPGGAITDAVTGIGDGIRDLLDPVLSIIGTITDTLRAAGLGGLADRISQIGGTLQVIDDGIRERTAQIATVTDGLVTRIGTLQSDGAAATRDTLPFLSDMAAGQSLIARELGDSGPIGRFINRYTDLEDSRGQAKLPGMRQVRPTDAPCGGDGEELLVGIENAGIWAAPLRYALSVMMSIQGTWAQLNVLVGWCRLAYLRANPHEPPSVADVMVQWIRGERNDRDTIRGIRQWGYDEDEARRMMASARTPLSIGLVQEAVRREYITPEKGEAELIRGGLRAEDAARAIAMREYVLPPQDVIRLAVREVFTPDARAAGNLDADYPSLLTERAARAGMTEQDAKDLWAAHWELPSMRQGVEMLHRGVIDEDTYRQLQRARDVAPAWRDRLTQIQYSPITRVDLRRLHAEGAISDERMKRGYADIGYSPEDADLMAEWTKTRSAAAAARAAKGDAAGLSRAAIIRLYRLGAIDRGRAVGMMGELDIAEDAAGGYLRAADLELEADAREDRIRAILERVRGDLVTARDAKAEISGLDLEPAERDLVMARLERLEATQAKHPSRADWDRWAKAGLVEEREYVSALAAMGWRTDWAQRFWQSRPGAGKE